MNEPFYALLVGNWEGACLSSPRERRFFLNGAITVDEKTTIDQDKGKQ